MNVSVQTRSSIIARYRPGVSAEVEWQPLLEGEASRNLRVLLASYRDHQFRMTVEGRPGLAYHIRLFTPWLPKPKEPARLVASQGNVHTLEVAAPSAVRGKTDKAGYVRWSIGVEFNGERK